METLTADRIKANPLLKRSGRIYKPENKEHLSIAEAVSKLRDTLMFNCTRMEERIRQRRAA